MNHPLYYVGLDVGATTMKAGVVDDDGRVLGAVKLPTNAHLGQDFGLQRMCETIHQAVVEAGLSLDQIAAIGVATPGLMDIPAGIVIAPANISRWRDVPVKTHIHTVFKKPTAFQNDANAAAYGEFWVGAGHSARSMVLFTLGTGIGGGIILEDRIIEGRHSHGAELGHIRIEMTNPRACGCGRVGCLEAYASATAVVKRTQEALAAGNGTGTISSLATAAGDLTARDVFQAAAAGDELAGRIIEETAYYLAVGAMNLMHVIDPDLVVFGGGMIAAGDAFLTRIRNHIAEMAFPIPATKTEVRFAHLGSDAGFIGAAGCGRLLVKAP